MYIIREDQTYASFGISLICSCKVECFPIEGDSLLKLYVGIVCSYSLRVLRFYQENSKWFFILILWVLCDDIWCRNHTMYIGFIDEPEGFQLWGEDSNNSILKPLRRKSDFASWRKNFTRLRFTKLASTLHGGKLMIQM